ncbi:MAG TPA: WG repeat-containing protein [Moheibacter sp.]|nr:WG repeat-containing protein [Moheibacter sp.]
MKHFLLIGFLFLYISTIGQVPNTARHGMDFSAAEKIPAKDPNQARYYHQNGKYGFVLPQNNRQEAIYDNISSDGNGFIVQKDNLYGIANKEGELIGKIEYDSIGWMYPNYIVKNKGKFGLMANDGSSLLTIKYNKILGGNSMVSLIEVKKGVVNLIYNKTEKKLPGKIEFANLYQNSAIIKKKGKFGLITDQIIVPFEYDSIAANLPRIPNSKSNLPAYNFQIRQAPVFEFIVINNEKLGLIDLDGKVIYPAESDEIKKEKTMGYILAKKGDLFSIYFTSSKRNTDFEFSRVSADGYGYIMAIKNEKHGAFNLEGEIIVPFEYDNTGIYQLSGIGLRVSKDRKRGIVNTEGKLIIPTMYDEVGTFNEGGFRHLLKVKNNEKTGIVNLENEVVIPLEFDWIGITNNHFKVLTLGENGKFGLYDTSGKVIVPAEYQWIKDSDTERSKVAILEKEHGSYNFLNQNHQLIFSENISEYGYVHDSDLLLNPFSSNGIYLLAVKNKNGKYGLFNEITETLDVPMIYDAIQQKFEAHGHTFYSVEKNGKFGLINEKNEVILPFQYSSIRLELLMANLENDYLIVVSKNNKFGAVNLQNEIKIPFQYADLQRISSSGLFKAKNGNKFNIINSKNQKINNETFDEVANFELIYNYRHDGNPNNHALTFNHGKMRIIDSDGKFVSSEVEMKPHNGFKSFEELKTALIFALNSNNDDLLKNFVDKVAPSEHILHYLKTNIFDDKPLSYVDLPYIKEKYFNELKKFQFNYWNDGIGFGWDRSVFVDESDYTLYRNGAISNGRNRNWDFGDRFLERLLRNSIKVNGNWISTYFMIRNF